MSKPENSIAINGAKYFTFQNAQGEWVNDPLVRQSIYTRTFIPIGRKYKMTDNKATMLNILRTDKVKFNPKVLSEETKVALIKANIDYEIEIVDIDVKPIIPKL